MNKDWNIEIVCSGAGNDNDKIGKSPCGRAILVKANDVIITYRKFWDGEMLNYFSVRCPHCQSITDLDERKLPEEVKNCAITQQEIRDSEIKMLLRQKM